MPLIYIELGRPRDFIKGGLNLVIGMLLIYKQNSFNTLNYLIFTVITTLLTFYIVEIFSIRWNQFCLLYTSPSPRDLSTSRMPSSA